MAIQLLLGHSAVIVLGVRVQIGRFFVMNAIKNLSNSCDVGFVVSVSRLSASLCTSDSKSSRGPENYAKESHNVAVDRR